MLWVLTFFLLDPNTGEPVSKEIYITPTVVECYYMGEDGMKNYPGPEKVQYTCEPAHFLTLKESTPV